MQRHPLPSAASASLQAAVPLSLSHRRTTPRPIPSADAPAEDEEDIHDPRPWESLKHPRTYGSAPNSSHSTHPSLGLSSDRDTGHLPMFHTDENEARRRVGAQPQVYGEKEGLNGAGEKQGLMDEDVSGKWGKPHGAGPGVGGRRGLPPRQRLSGWVRYPFCVVQASG